MSDRARQLLTRGVAAAKANDREEAELYLEWVLRTDSTHAQKIRAWEYLAQITDDPKKKRDYLEELIIHEPGNVAARRGLAMLNGDLKAEEVVDSTHRPADSKTPPPAQADMRLSSYGPEQVKGEAAQSKRYVCQQCSGTMAFTPDGQSLTCNYCDRQISLYQAVEEGAMVQERDFAVALATAKGHTHPVTMQSFSCQGCGAHFVLGPAVHSITCPYCSSAYVIEKRQTRSLIPPEGVIPFAFNQKKARQSLYQWLKKKKLLDDCQTSSPLGLYLPVWTFDIAGQVVARVRGYRPEAGGIKMPSQTIERPVFYNDIPVSASHRLPAKLAEEIHNYQLDKVLPYNPGYLADWPAATYQISAATASLIARKRAWKDVRSIVRAQIKDQIVGPFGSSDVDMALSSAKMYVEAFKLIFLPIWLIRYRYQDKIYDTVVNGQNGHVRGETPSGKLKGWLRRIFKDEG